MKKFIVSRLLGGMGNQMFEYAFARALSLRNGMELYLDACALDPKRHTRFSLGAFNVGAPFVDAERKSLVITPRFEIKRRLYKALKIPYRLSPTHLREKSFAFDPSVLSVENSRYVEGLWQSEKYFSDFADAIRADFAFRDAEKLSRHPLFGEVEKPNSVAVHVRRGDYVSKPKYRRILHICRKRYYEGAIRHVSERVENARFFVASDDPGWVRENFGGKNVVLIEPSGHFEDFYLMSRCRHAVISNSTFSWWSAWLGEAGKPGRITVAPDMWFAPSVNIDYSDIIPDRWTKLPTGYGDSAG